jgi:hypothetical protein
MFNERNLWIAVTVRSFTSTKMFLAINLSASAGITDTKNEKLHWFEGKIFFFLSTVKFKVLKNRAQLYIITSSFGKPKLSVGLRCISKRRNETTSFYRSTFLYDNNKGYFKRRALVNTAALHTLSNKNQIE